MCKMRAESIKRSSYERIEALLWCVRAVRWNRERLSEGSSHIRSVFLWWQRTNFIAVIHTAPSYQLGKHRKQELIKEIKGKVSENP